MPTQTDANCGGPAHFQDRSAVIIPVTAQLLDLVCGYIKASKSLKSLTSLYISGHVFSSGYVFKCEHMTLATQRMQEKIDALCTERDRLKAEQAKPKGGRKW